MGLYGLRHPIQHIHVADKLHHIGVQLPSSLCPLCNTSMETIEYLMVECNFATHCRLWTFKWCDIDDLRISTVVELLDFAARWENCPKKRPKFITIVYESNMVYLVFNELFYSPAMVADNIISLSFSWVKHMGNICDLKWSTWNVSPL
uniref:Reverse transcriptase zinc-binding domain-containing protein n=1 Tax=Lactuca sativa TaxID=4236 RepID=A0A9R1UQ84_LACSA|nr:hypothetical protein LSAT_V11C800412380 [Lactuca sativa]